jgi:hypothetical protein
VVIFRLEHISANSIMEVLAQLGRAEGVADMLKKVPFAVNEPANAVVVVGPPEVVEFFERLVGGLDKPSAFHERMGDREMQRRRQEMDLKTEMKHRELELKAKMAPMAPRPGAKPMALVRPVPPTAAARPLTIPGPGRPGAARPGAEFFGRLLSPPVVEQLRLDPDQLREIRKVAAHVRDKAGEMRRRVMEAIGHLPPEERKRKAEEIARDARGRRGEVIAEIRKRIFEILRPDQRVAAAKLLRAPIPGRREEPVQPERPQPRPEPPRAERRPEEGPARKGPREEDRRPREPRLERREEPERPRVMEMTERGLGDPLGEFVERLLSPPVAEKIRLEDPQHEKIREMHKAYRRELEEIRERVARELREMPAERRAQKAETILREVRGRIGDMAGEVRERIVKVLRPEQRERLEQTLRAPGAPREERPARPERRGEPERRPREEEPRRTEREEPRERDR